MGQSEPDVSETSKSVYVDATDEPKKDPSATSTEKKQFSLYECPTAACSIISGAGQHEQKSSFCHTRFKTFSLDGSENENNSYRHEETSEYSTQQTPKLSPTSFSGEGGSVSYTQLRQPTGGYIAQSEGMLIKGGAMLSERPKNLLGNATFSGLPVTNVRSVIMPPASAASTPTAFPQNDNVLGKMVGRSFVSAPQTPTMRDNATARHINVSPSVCSASPAVKDYSRAVDCGNTSETSFFHEGYDTIQVPRYRPVEIVEKTVEVPVVHHVDTYVAKKEVQEIESFVKKPYIKYVNKVVDVPEIHYNDTIVEVPEYHEVTKTVQKVEIQERIKYVPKVEVKIVPKYVEVPVVEVVDRYEEYEEVEEVIRHVEKVEIVEVPREVIKHVVKPVKKIIEQERIIPVVEHRDVPVEKIKFVPKIETVELIREVPKVVDVPVPYNVFKVEYIDEPYVVPEYRDVPVAVPVRKVVTPIYHYNGEPEVIDVPVHKPYLVIHDHIEFKPAAQPIAENLRVVGSRPLDLNLLSENERLDAEARMKGIFKETILNADSKTNETYQQNTAKQDSNIPPKGVVTYNHAPAQSHLPTVNIPANVRTQKEAMQLPEVTFVKPEKATPKKRWQGKSMETIIYSNSPKAGMSPCSDQTQRDAYPPSNSVTPRIVF